MSYLGADRDTQDDFICTLFSMKVSQRIASVSIQLAHDSPMRL